VSEINGTNRNGINGFFKIIMTFIDRVGFPILAFLIISYICFISLKELTTAVQDNKIVISELKGCMDRNTQAVLLIGK
jgi:hypothetical protein